MESIAIYHLILRGQTALDKMGMHSAIEYFSETFQMLDGFKWESMNIKTNMRIANPIKYNEHVQKFIGQSGIIPMFPGT
jgi:hypothetical protein